MKKIKLFIFYILLVIITCLISISTKSTADEPPIRMGGKKVLTGPNGRFGCDCTKEEYVNCYCQIQKN
jgi:hypothetical protein